MGLAGSLLLSPMDTATCLSRPPGAGKVQRELEPNWPLTGLQGLEGRKRGQVPGSLCHVGAGLTPEGSAPQAVTFEKNDSHCSRDCGFSD